MRCVVLHWLIAYPSTSLPFFCIQGSSCSSCLCSEEQEEGPFGTVLGSECGKLLPQLFPLLRGTATGQPVGCVEFIDCALCSGDFLSVFASRVQLKSLSIINGYTYTSFDLIMDLSGFKSLHELSIGLHVNGDEELHLADLRELRALEKLSLAKCIVPSFSELDVLAHLPHLRELILPQSWWFGDEDIRLASCSLHTLHIDTLAFFHHTISTADLPALKKLSFSKFHLSGAPVDDVDQLRHVIRCLSALPLHVSVPENTSFRFSSYYPSHYPSEWPVDAAVYEQKEVSILRVILDSPLAVVFQSIQCAVSLESCGYTLYSGSKELIHNLFPNAARISGNL